MPLKYKLPGYLGNALLVVLGLIVAVQGSLLTGIMLSALGILNVYLVYKLDSYSQPEAALAHELELTKLKQELIIAQKQVNDLQTSAPDTKIGR
jgi:hypothetical protein